MKKYTYTFYSRVKEFRVAKSIFYKPSVGLCLVGVVPRWSGRVFLLEKIN